MSAEFADFVRIVLVRMSWVVLVYFVLVNGWYLVLLCSAVLEMRLHVRMARWERLGRVLGSPAAPTITMLAPAYNEAATIAESVRGFLTLSYQNLEVVVVSDGSRDATVDVMMQEFDLVPVHIVYDRRIEHRPVVGLYRSGRYPNLILVDKENGGKADALNAALNMATGDLVCAMDADTLVERDALQRMVRPFLAGGDVLAVGGTIRVANGCVARGGKIVDVAAPRRPLPGFQVIEYLRAFLFGRLGWNRLGGNLIISGAFGLFRRESVIAAGGYLHETVGEDMELVLRLRERGYVTGGPTRIDFIPDPVAWTEVPESLAVLRRQRDRWHRGLADVLWRYRRILFNPRYRALGLVVFPYFVFVELLAPVVEAAGVVAVIVGFLLGMIDVPFAILFFLVAYGLGIVLTVATLALEEFSFHRYDRWRDRAFLVVWAMLENLGYRQLTVLWRLEGLIKYFRGRRDWGVMERRGFKKA